MPDHDELRSLLAQVRRRWLALARLGRGARAAAAASIPLFAAALAAWALRPAGMALVALVVLALVGAVAVVFLIARIGRRPGGREAVARVPSDREVARFIEERAGVAPGVPAVCERDTLVSAVDVVNAPGRHAATFAPLIVAQALAALRAVDPAAVVPTAALRRALLGAGAGVLLLAVALALMVPHLRDAGGAIWIALFPHSIQIVVRTGDVRVVAGQPLRIMAAVQGRGAAWLTAEPALVVSAGGAAQAVPMTRTAEGFDYAFESVDRSFTYRVTAGRAVSRAYSVTALVAPRVTRVDLEYDFPAFSGLPPRTEEDGGDIYAPAGTRVRLLVHTDKPVAEGRIALARGQALPLQRGGAGVTSAEITVAADDAYRVHVTDEDGLSSARGLEYFIRLMDDRPPDVRILRPSSDQGITPLEEVAIEARAEDDYGVARFDLVYTVAGRAPIAVPFSRAGGTAVAKVGAHLLAAEELGVQPGDVITYYARARDVGRGKRSSETRSDIFFLEVKPFAGEFTAAQSQAMAGGAAATQVESLIAAQKEIISATWNLERRSGAGRSTEDLRAVGQAQAELKTRAEGLAGRGRRGRGMFAPQQIVRPPAAGPQPAQVDPVMAAIAAMGRAVEQLSDERTKEAIPHQMEALQGLLRAQAEVRRRQVMQQSASGAGQGGSSRSDRDLSALFDRELQRQQRTNYETPASSSEGAPAGAESAAAERVRELARRQEELARRQRELADAERPGEEARRQLEQLLRDQQELRQEAAALEKALRGRQAGDMRRALGQMREAAGEMQRRNAEGAAARGGEAAESLRRMERNLRAGPAGAEQRAAGELQLEAQQIAEAQRRVAAETSRIEADEREPQAPAADGSANRTRDALRRLAAEQRALADRVDQLQQGARQAERETPGAEGTRFREAARQLQEGRIGSRMRSSAGEMEGGRQAAAPGARARARQELSEALDAVVDALGGGGQSEARRLTAELDRTREMRERLQRLEDQVRAAEARPGGGQGSPGAAGADQQRARASYAREAQRTLATLGRPRTPPGGGAGSTPESHEYSRSAPGNEAFKQDFGSWETLRKDVQLALEQHEAAVAARLTRKPGDRLSAGGNQRVPDGYRPLVSSYFEAIAKGKR